MLKSSEDMIVRCRIKNEKVKAFLSRIPRSQRGLWVEALLCKALNVEHPLLLLEFLKADREQTEQVKQLTSQLRNIF